MTMIGASNFPQLCSRFIRMDPPPTVAIPHSSTAENLRAIKPRGIIRFIQADFWCTCENKQENQSRCHYPRASFIKQMWLKTLTPQQNFRKRLLIFVFFFGHTQLLWHSISIVGWSINKNGKKKKKKKRIRTLNWVVGSGTWNSNPS